jgi:flagellar hook protein FlgE
MGFQTGLTGLNVFSKTLDVIGNNIANANTVGMKYSRTEYADLASVQPGSRGGSGIGFGVSIATTAQQFTQGNFSVTGNALDLAINGNGFFQVVNPNGTKAYTRDGQFKVDKEGNLMTNSGANVMGYKTDKTGIPESPVLPQKISIPSGAPIAASETKNIVAGLNLTNRAQYAIVTTPQTPIATYGTAITAYDAQGSENPVSLYFSRGPSDTTDPQKPKDVWYIYDANTQTDGDAEIKASATAYAAAVTAAAALVPPGPAPDPSTFDGDANRTKALFKMEFDSEGQLLATYKNGTGANAGTFTATDAVGQLDYEIDPKNVNPSTIVGPFNVKIDLAATTQFSDSFAINKLTQDGYTSGSLTGININSSGQIITNYSNGQTQVQAVLVLADFRNTQGLTNVGGGNYIETLLSGTPVLGTPGIGKFGDIRSGALEDSNVDLTGELVNMMVAQRNYQANAQTIKTQDQVLSTLVNLR